MAECVCYTCDATLSAAVPALPPPVGWYGFGHESEPPLFRTLHVADFTQTVSPASLWEYTRRSMQPQVKGSPTPNPALAQLAHQYQQPIQQPQTQPQPQPLPQRQHQQQEHEREHKQDGLSSYHSSDLGHVYLNRVHRLLKVPVRDNTVAVCAVLCLTAFV